MKTGRFVKIICAGVAALTCMPVIYGQGVKITGDEFRDARVPSVGRAPLRSEFVSYDMREHAEKRTLQASTYYRKLDMQSSGRRLTADIDIPILWLDRDLFVHVEGLGDYYIFVNGASVGYAEDSRTPSEFLISPWLRDGVNTVAFEPVGGTGSLLEDAMSGEPHRDIYIYSQPKVRIEDYTITALPDSTNSYGILEIEIAMVNSYNAAETVTVGYDIYSPQNKLQHFDKREVIVPGNGRDTVRFREFIYGTQANLWEAGKGNLYHGMMIVTRGGHATEYLPYRVGFGQTEVRDGALYRNGKAIDIKAAAYNAAADAKTTEADIKKLQQGGVNTIWVDYPQPVWFYDICDRAGMYVIDQANVNSSHETSNRALGGALSNAPAWLPTFMERTQAMYERAKNHVSIVGWSLGGRQGNGYNMYRTYQWLKGAEPHRAVIYNDSAGEWNSDLPSVEVKR